MDGLSEGIVILTKQPVYCIIWLVKKLLFLLKCLKSVGCFTGFSRMLIARG
jgi:hypothetical protein